VYPRGGGGSGVVNGGWCWGGKKGGVLEKGGGGGGECKSPQTPEVQGSKGGPGKRTGEQREYV